MALAEDAASVLDQFVQDVANLPAEIAHLLEEIQAKDLIMHECRSVINTRDTSIQKFLKLNGAGQPNPKEESYAKTILANFDRSQIIQEEKIGLSEKAAALLDRQIRRLDLKISSLQADGSIPPDPTLPSLLHPSSNSATSSRALNPLPLNIPSNPHSANPSTTIANNPHLSRLVPPIPPSSTTQQTSRHPSPNPHLHHASTIHLPSNSSSLADAANKRRRLNATLPPSTSSSLRQSSLGPGTGGPSNKSSTPLSSSARGTSAGPRPPSQTTPSTFSNSLAAANHLNKKPSSLAAGRKVAPHQRVGTLKRKSGGGAAAAARRLKRGKAGSPSSTGGDESASALSEMGDGSEGENGSAASHSARRGGARRAGSTALGGSADGPADGDADGEEPGDDKNLYCTCRSVSYGNMIACDNDECPREWFHWDCVGMTREPTGSWYCDECRERLGLGV